MYWLPKYNPLSCYICNNQSFAFRYLYINVFYSRHCIYPLQLITNVTIKIFILTHKLWKLPTPNIKYMRNYNYIFTEPYRYFTPLLHILFNIISSSTLPLISLESPIEAIVAPSDTRSTVIHSSHTLMSPILTKKKLPQMNQMLYYLHNYALLYNFSVLARHICRKLPYDFLHQSWRNHMRPFTPLKMTWIQYWF